MSVAPHPSRGPGQSSLGKLEPAMPERAKICSACFHLIAVDAAVCPECGTNPASQARDLSALVVGALNHPLDEMRMRCILTLGWCREANASQPLLARALRNPVDIVEGLAVVGSLLMLGDDGRRALRELADRHPAAALRKVAADALAATSRPGDSHA